MKETTGTEVGKKSDWGKTRPFWCLSCGEGFPSVERVHKHYAAALLETRVA
jgi:hypothetical protein